ncbi:MAG: twin-arginine translocation signal domain-containing protein [Gemmataceae bacterium]|nr:twin-arginine translocation signal domain-containing protein [Gemmataceae bacterium]
MVNRREFLRTTAGLAAAVTLPGVAAAQGTVTEGIDVSNYQGTINWASVAADTTANVKFAICKCTEGLTFTDAKFATNWAAIKANNLIRGAYHYARFQNDPIAECRFFVSTMKPSSGDLPPVVDVEATGNSGFTGTQIKNWLQRFCAELKKKTGRPGIIYTGYYYWRDSAGNSPNNWGFPLWHAQYSSSPTLGNSYLAWPGGWTFWQYTSSGTVAGISGAVDRDQFNGSLATLNGLRLP